MTAKSLDPPDFERCQALFQLYRPFVMGGPVRTWERCHNRPHWLVTERKPGPDGQKGSMTMCDGCAKVFIEQQKDTLANFDMDWITEGEKT